MRLGRFGRALLASAVWMSMSGLAEAALSPPQAPKSASSEGIVVFPVQVDGSLAGAWKELLDRRLLGGLERTDRAVVSGSQDGRCEAPDCWVDMARRARGRYLVAASVGVDGRDFEVLVQLIDGRSGETVAQSGETCEVCAMQEVGDMMAAHAAIVGTKLDALSRAAPIMKFESVPPGAVVYLDGKLVGTAPVELSVDPGPHRARAELKRHVALEQQVEAVTGTGETVTFELQPIPRRQRIQPLGWVLVGSGIISTVAGVTLIAIDEQPYRSRCTGEYVDEFGNCRLRYDTLAGGIALTAVGVAALTAGGIIVGLGRRRARDRTVTASVWWGRAPGMSLRGRF